MGRSRKVPVAVHVFRRWQFSYVWRKHNIFYQSFERNMLEIVTFKIFISCSSIFPPDGSAVPKLPKPRFDMFLKLKILTVGAVRILAPWLLDLFQSAGTRNPHQHGLRRGAPPLGRLPCPHAAVRRLEEGVGHQGDQHGGIPAPEACPLPARFHPQRH